eukprot:jgi/Psemu1/10965/gm1.10965_g
MQKNLTWTFAYCKKNVANDLSCTVHSKLIEFEPSERGGSSLFLKKLLQDEVSTTSKANLKSLILLQETGKMKSDCKDEDILTLLVNLFRSAFNRMGYSTSVDPREFILHCTTTNNLPNKPTAVNQFLSESNNHPPLQTWKRGNCFNCGKPGHQKKRVIDEIPNNFNENSGFNGRWVKHKTPTDGQPNTGAALVPTQMANPLQYGAAPTYTTNFSQYGVPVQVRSSATIGGASAIMAGAFFMFDDKVNAASQKIQLKRSIPSEGDGAVSVGIFGPPTGKGRPSKVTEPPHAVPCTTD